MDKASDFGSEDCRFESCHGRNDIFCMQLGFQNLQLVIFYDPILIEWTHTLHTRQTFHFGNELDPRGIIPNSDAYINYKFEIIRNVLQKWRFAKTNNSRYLPIIQILGQENLF